MGPLLVAAAGVVALGLGVAILRSFGPRYRVGRLLAVVPAVPIAEAVRIANAGESRYIRVDGRIDSYEEFALVLTRRSGGGVHEAIAVVEDAALVERAIRSVGS